jgi:hypothetical protein
MPDQIRPDWVDAGALILTAHRPRIRRSFTNDNTVLDCCGQTFGNATRRARRDDEARSWSEWEEHAVEAVLSAVADDIARQAETEALAPIKALADEWGRGYNSPTASSWAKVHADRLRAAIRAAEGGAR